MKIQKKKFGVGEGSGLGGQGGCEHRIFVKIQKKKIYGGGGVGGGVGVSLWM